MADTEHRRDGEEEEEEEDIDETGYKTIKDAVVFAIDVSKSMLAPPPASDNKKADRDSATSAALKCAYQLMQQRIISNPNDMMGVLLFGTEQSKFQEAAEAGRSSLAYPHCYLLVDLDVPEAADVKRLRNLVEDEDESARLLVPSKEPVTLANMFFCVNQIFTTKAPNFSSRRLFLVTDEDNPNAHNKQLDVPATTRAKDLFDLGVTIDLFPISKPGRNFDRSIFYDNCIYASNPSDPDAPAPVSSAARAAGSGDGITLLQALLSNINSKAAPKRALFSLPMEIGPGLKIGVKGYILIKRQEHVRSCYVWVSGEKPQIAVGSSTWMADDTARTVEKTEVRKAYKLGGETISFSKDEMSAIKYFGDPVIRIIGFKPMSSLPIWANTRPSVFIYPSDNDFVGSTRVFSALQQKLLRDQKMGLAWYIPRRNATPVLAAVIPGAEKLGDHGEQVTPPGLWLINLPYADDIRQDPETNPVAASNPDRLVDLMRKIVQQLQLPKGQYDPKKYPNPHLQWFYRILQAIALEEDIPEKPEDKTVPRYKQIDKRAGDYVQQWGEELEAQFAEYVASSGHRQNLVAGSKRGAAHDDDAKPVKKSRTVKAEGSGISDEEMREHFEKDTISKLTVPMLKEWAHAKKLSSAGKKADLVERIQEYFESK